jgi:hypothetical protein
MWADMDDIEEIKKYKICESLFASPKARKVLKERINIVFM